MADQRPRGFSQQTNGSINSTQMRSNTLPNSSNNNNPIISSTSNKINSNGTTTTTTATNNNIDKQFADLNINKKPTATKSTTSSSSTSSSTNTTSYNNKMVEYSFMLTLPNGTSVPRTLVYTNSDKIIGNGSFGVVFMAKFKETGEMVAIKKVLQDKRFKNRELQIMKAIKHSNIVEMKHCFYTTAPLNSVNTTNTGNAVANNPALTTLTLPVNNSVDPNDPNCEVFLNLVLEYVPDTVYRFCTQYTKHKDFMPLIYVKLFIFQLCKSLAYLHSMRICHRDIKPQNLLIDPNAGVLKLCDFGSAKQLIKNEPNVSYICSRYYRAPELIFGATNYTTTIDVWSVGCVMGECLIGQPLFPGESSVDQLVEIIRVLGTPTREEVEAMNKNYTEFKFPQVKPHPWSKVFQDRKPPVTPETIDLLQQFLQYNPNKRVSPMDALAHPFFDELRDPQARLPNGKNLPSNLFEFSQYEWRMLVNPENRVKILPK